MPRVPPARQGEQADPRPIKRLGRIEEIEGEPQLCPYEEESTAAEQPAAAEPRTGSEFTMSDDEKDNFHTPAFLRRQAE